MRTEIAVEGAHRPALRNREAIDGKGLAAGVRQCVSCHVNDTEVNKWQSERYCWACAKSITRNGACRCGRAKRKYTSAGAHCPVCDEEAIRYHVDTKFRYTHRRVILVAPKDDRERVFWRATGWFFGQKKRVPKVGEDYIKVASASEWTSWR